MGVLLDMFGRIIVECLINRLADAQFRLLFSIFPRNGGNEDRFVPAEDDVYFCVRMPRFIFPSLLE